MKLSRRLFELLAAAFALSLFASGCYTRLATEDEGEGTSEAQYDVPRSHEEGDTLEPRQSYYDDYDQWRYHHWIGFSYYYPGMYDSWYWGSSFWYPYSPYQYYGFGYGYGYGYGYPYSYYGSPYPYDYYRSYSGYPYVVYNGPNQTRESGYRRTGAGRASSSYYGSGATSGASLSVPPASRRSGAGRDAGVSRPSNRSTQSSSGRGSSRSYAPPSRSSAPSARQAPSGGSSRGSSGTSGGSRGSGTTRSRYESPLGSHRYDAPASRGYTPSYTPSYAPSRSPSYSPPPSSAPSSAPSSGGSQGGTRSGGATRSGRN